MEKLFIAYISTFDLRGNTAATEHVTQTVNGLADAGLKVLFLTRSAGNRKFHSNVETHEFGLENSFFFERRAVTYLRKLTCALNVLQSAIFRAQAICQAICIRAKIPYVIEHNGLYYIEMRQMPRNGIQLSYAWDRLFCIRRRMLHAAKNVVFTNAIATIMLKNSPYRMNSLFTYRVGLICNGFTRNRCACSSTKAGFPSKRRFGSVILVRCILGISSTK
jgi:hypothetical protein